MARSASRLWLLAFVALGPASAAPQASAIPSPALSSPASVSVEAHASKTEVTVSEPFTVEVKASGPAGTLFSFPSEISNDTLELRTAPVPKAAPPPAPGTHLYEAAVFTLGEAEIPPIAVRVRLADGTSGEAASPALKLEVRSLLPKDPQQQKLADVRPPVTVSIGAGFWLAVGLAAAAVVGAIVWLLRRRRPGTPAAAPAPDLPPDVEALRDLDALAASGLLASGEYRAAYIRLTTIAKRYLERRLAAPILEMTTVETLAFLRGHPQTGELLPAMRDLADAADRIKFANAAGLRDETERHLASVRSLVAALEARLRPVVQEAEGRAA